MPKAPAAADTRVATTQELRRAALQRSARRNARVARWRLGWRWLLWALGRLGRWLSLPLALGLGLAWAWHAWHASAATLKPAASPSPPSAGPQPAAPAPAPAPTTDPGVGLSLRLDAGPANRRRPARLPSAQPARASAAQPEESL